MCQKNMWVLLVSLFDIAKDVVKRMVRARIEENDGKIYVSPYFRNVENRSYEIVKADDLYEMIHEGIALSIHGVCVERFSMSDYREKYEIPHDEDVNVCIDMVTNCLFCAKNGVALDFLHCNFIAADEVAGIMFEDNIFYQGKVDFSCSKIENHEFSMKGCHFINSEVVFAYTSFNEKDIYFNEMSLKENVTWILSVPILERKAK